jgi:hypothetical protein
VLPLVIDEVANDVADRLAQEILVAQDVFDRIGNPAQTPRSLPVLGFEIANRRRCDWITRLGFSTIISSFG